MIVKIKKCQNKNDWYRELIGDMFEVVPSENMISGKCPRLKGVVHA